MTMAEERLLTVAQVAERLGAHPETIRRWLAAGRLRGTLPGGDRFGWRIRESDLDAFLSAHEPGDGERREEPER